MRCKHIKEEKPFRCSTVKRCEKFTIKNLDYKTVEKHDHKNRKTFFAIFYLHFRESLLFSLFKKMNNIGFLIRFWEFFLKIFFYTVKTLMLYLKISN